MFLTKKVTITLFIFVLCALVALPIIADRVDDIHKGHLKFMNNLVENNLNKQKKLLARFNKFANRVARMSKGFHIRIPVSEKYAKKIKRNNHTGRLKWERKKYAYVSEPYRLRANPRDNDSNYITTVRRRKRVQVLYAVSVKKSRGNITTRWMSVKYYGKEGFIPLNLLSKTRPRAFNFEPKMQLVFDGDIDSIHSDIYSHHYSRQQGSCVNANYTAIDPSIFIKAYNKKRRVTAKPFLTMRAEGTTGAAMIGKVYYGEIVDVIRYGKHQYIDGKNARWAKINYSGSVGWVYGGYLERVRTGKIKKISKLESGENYYVKSQLLRLREEPSTSSIVILSIPNQEEVYSKEVSSTSVQIGKTRSKWVKVRYEGYTGWVFGGYLAGKKTKQIDKDSLKYQNMSHKQYVWPVRGYRRISSRYGWRRIFGRRNYHRGIDIVAPKGAPIRASKTGQCISSRYNRGYGYYVVLDHGKGNRTLYAHMSKKFARKGRMYKAGRTIGLVGSTGRSTGAHLHFEIRIHNKHVNPGRYVHP